MWRLLEWQIGEIFLSKPAASFCRTRKMITLKVEAVRFLQPFMSLCQITWYQVPGDRNINFEVREKHKYQLI